MADYKGKKSDSKSSNDVSRVQIELSAYYRWMNRGCPIGDDMKDWVDAEREFTEEGKSSKSKKGT